MRGAVPIYFASVADGSHEPQPVTRVSGDQAPVTQRCIKDRFAIAGRAGAQAVTATDRPSISHRSSSHACAVSLLRVVSIASTPSTSRRGRSGLPDGGNRARNTSPVSRLAAPGQAAWSCPSSSSARAQIAAPTVIAFNGSPSSGPWKFEDGVANPVRAVGTPRACSAARIGTVAPLGSSQGACPITSTKAALIVSIAGSPNGNWTPGLVGRTVISTDAPEG